VKLKRFYLFFIVISSCFCSVFGQNIGLYEQFNGHYDFTFVGNTMNSAENNSTMLPVTGTSSTASLNLNANDIVEKAFLYWAGSGDGDFDVTFNSTVITPDRTFGYTRTINNVTFSYFSAFKDVTGFIQSSGNGDYTLSDLDIAPFEELHLTRKTNFAGWALIIVYENSTLPVNQINIYDGLQAVPDDVSILLNSLNVLDNNNSKAGVLAWEGDRGLATEEFMINGNPLSNTLNPANNVFNGTNSVTGSNALYNMDLDIYDIQDNIQIGDTSAEITLSSFQDFVMINTLVIKLNNQLPDATVVIDNVDKQCDSRNITITYTVSNFDCTNTLPAGTPITIYANGIIVGYDQTTLPIHIGESFQYQISIMISNDIPSDFNLSIVVDDIGNGIGIIPELIEDNNNFDLPITFGISPLYNTLATLVSCNEGLTKGTFNFSNYAELVKVNQSDTVSFYENSEDATNENNAIFNTNTYVATETPKEIFVRIDNENCYSLTSFLLNTKNCPPTVYNYVSANNDSANNEFFIAGLRDVFLNFKLEIYNRWGQLVWTGNNNVENWKGYIKDGIGNKNAPDGTYFYLLFLNDVDYPQPLTGYLFLKN
jgi:gliding motility-associated-like protein